MTNTHREKKIYFFDYSKNCFVKEFSCEDELVKFLALSCMSNFPHQTYRFNHLFDFINMNGNDTYTFPSYNEYEKPQKYLRPYIFIDEYDRIIDIRIFADKVNKEINELLKENGKTNDDDFKYGDILIRGKNKFRYRIDPVPNLFKRRKYKFLRHVKTFNETRNNHSDENKKYVRAKRLHLPTLYDDIPRHFSKSWKDQSKKKKQYL